MRDEDLFVTLDPESNSLALLIQHMAGNLISRWTDFLTTDGEKPDRDRDSEFVAARGDDPGGPAGPLGGGVGLPVPGARRARPRTDLTRTVYIRAEPHSVVKAIDRQLTHQAYHAGQIVLLAKHFASAALADPLGAARRDAGISTRRCSAAVRHRLRRRRIIVWAVFLGVPVRGGGHTL